MGVKALWSGLTLITAVPALLGLLGLGGASAFMAAGAIIMVIGVVLLWMDK